MSKRECPDYEEKVSLDLPPGTTLEELGDKIMQSDVEPSDDLSTDTDGSLIE